MAIYIINFLYGLCIMFFGMMSWSFWRKNDETISRLVSITMLVLGLQCVKDLSFIWTDVVYEQFFWRVMTCVDMMAVPLYSFILRELCRPGIKLKSLIYHELPFIFLPIIFVITKAPLFYYINVTLCGLYGFYYAMWAVVALPKYHRLLSQRFSYDENINLKWLKTILISFFAIYALWMLSSAITDIVIDIVYLAGTLVLWMANCYFIYRHESVIDELNDCPLAEEPVMLTDDELRLAKIIHQLFDEQQVFLNPHLKLSDLATLARSNRTYVSRIFNTHYGKTFYEFVNEYRVEYAKNLLATSSEKLDVIADMSGFASRQSFYRIFGKFVGCTPEHYRSATHS